MTSSRAFSTPSRQAAKRDVMSRGSPDTESARSIVHSRNEALLHAEVVMTPERFEEIRLAFEAVVEHSPAERCTLLEKIGREDPDLAREVERLLAAREHESSLLDGQAAAHLLGLAAAEAPPEGRQVGAYRILRRIAEGGMGVVYEAHRADDVFAKKVAIKICSATLVGETIRDRFRRERQILARLEHPRIARILDGGTTEEGSPYFVMEFVDGLPLDRWVRER